MKKFMTLALAGALVLGISSAVYANVCAFDPVPAATILYPFVAFDYNNPVSGTTTLFAVTNVSSEAQIVHFTLWTDDSVAILDWNVVLSGYDVQVQNIRDIIYLGLLPQTGTASPLIVSGPTPADDGPVAGSRAPWLDASGSMELPIPESTASATFAARCDSNSQSYPDYEPIPQGFLDLFRGYLTATQEATKLHAACYTSTPGTLSPADWWQLRTADEPTWMYITADVVWECNKLFPFSDGYWALPAADGQAQFQNVLMGDVFYVNSDLRFSEADNAVHLEADQDLAVVANTDTLGNPYSFYYRYSGGIDYREPLPTAWAFRYIGAGVNTMDTYIRAWKGSSEFTSIRDLDYDGRYIAIDCIPYTYYAWDEDEQVITVDENPWSFPGVTTVRPNLLPLETQEVEVDQFNTPDSDGWMLFVWPASNFPAGSAIGTLNDEIPDYYQTWMGVKYAAFGDYSATRSGIVMGNFNCFADQILPVLGVDYNYVDAGGYRVSPGITVPVK